MNFRTIEVHYLPSHITRPWNPFHSSYIIGLRFFALVLVDDYLTFIFSISCVSESCVHSLTFAEFKHENNAISEQFLPGYISASKLDQHCTVERFIGIVEAAGMASPPSLVLETWSQHSFLHNWTNVRVATTHHKRCCAQLFQVTVRHEDNRWIPITTRNMFQKPNWCPVSFPKLWERYHLPISNHVSAVYAPNMTPTSPA